MSKMVCILWEVATACSRGRLAYIRVLVEFMLLILVLCLFVFCFLFFVLFCFCFCFCFLSSTCVLCIRCCQFLWIVHAWLQHRISLPFIEKVPSNTKNVCFAWHNQESRNHIFTYMLLVMKNVEPWLPWRTQQSVNQSWNYFVSWPTLLLDNVPCKSSNKILPVWDSLILLRQNSNLESCYHFRNSDSLRVRVLCNCRTRLDWLYNTDIYGWNQEIINMFVLILENFI